MSSSFPEVHGLTGTKCDNFKTLRNSMNVIMQVCCDVELKLKQVTCKIKIDILFFGRLL